MAAVARWRHHPCPAWRALRGRPARRPQLERDAVRVSPKDDRGTRVGGSSTKASEAAEQVHYLHASPRGQRGLAAGLTTSSSVPHCE